MPTVAGSALSIGMTASGRDPPAPGAGQGYRSAAAKLGAAEQRVGGDRPGLGGPERWLA
jgi:hypothetical protein